VVRRTNCFEARPGSKYIAFYKPYAVLCQFSQPPDSNKRSLAEFGFPKNVYPIGRLDYDSEGLLLLSDDKRMNQALLNPDNAHERFYLAQIENIPTAAALAKLARGVLIEGSVTAQAKVNLLEKEPELPPRAIPIRVRKNIPTAWIQLTLKEGRNRQVRKMTAAIGHPTLRLIRIAIGSLGLLDLDLAPGQWRALSESEMNLAFERGKG
jgi:23S rRNA pseudouridine2457 synthase